MSIAVDWQRPSTVPNGRAQLRLVPPPAPEAATRTGVRRGGLTRRGRLVRTLAVFTVLAVIVLMRVAPLGPGELAVDHAVTVRSGQSLSQVAAEQLPDMPVAEAVRQLRSLNDLSGDVIYAGQSLLVPVPPR